MTEFLFLTLCRYILMGYHMTLQKCHPLVAKEDHPFENCYEKSLEKELRNKLVVAKVR